MKRIGIVTIHRINNFGAVEQAYALNSYLRSIGFDVETIDFRTERVAESYKFFYSSFSMMNCIRNIQSLLYYCKLKRRNIRFENFISSNVPLSCKSYYSNQDLKEASLDYDYVICGSDQIWNTFCRNYDDAFILDFARDKAIRISYAASLGHDAINGTVVEKFKENLSSFNAISVRETSAVPLIESISGQQVTHVVDPVFLLDEKQWSQVAPDVKIKEPYIFCYYVKGDLPGMRMYARKIAKESKMKVVVVNMNLREMLYCNTKCYDAGPGEFISLIKNAAFVCTNSFHACAFSIIFKKKFVIFTDSVSPRLKSILGMLGLESRMAYDGADTSVMYKNIDFSDVYDRLNPMIAKSKDFLSNALNCCESKN